MNKAIIGIITVVVIALGAGVAVSNSDKDTAGTDGYTVNGEEYTGSTRDNEIPVTENINSEATVAYSASALAESETENNVLFFHASWCSVCNAVERNIEAGTVPADLTIFKVDYDSPEGQKLADEYNIAIQYSMVQVANDGTEVTQWVNNFNDGIDEISAKLQQV